VAIAWNIFCGISAEYLTAAYKDILSKIDSKSSLVFSQLLAFTAFVVDTRFVIVLNLM
jgi:hypothetical protein